MVQIDRLELLAGQGLFEGRELQDRAEDGCHSPVVCESLVVKDQVLQSSLFDSLQDKAVGAVNRGDHFNRPSLQGDGFFGTVSGADAASQADRLVDDGSSFFGRSICSEGSNNGSRLIFHAADCYRPFLIIEGGVGIAVFHGNGQNGAHFLAFSAGDAVVVIDFRDIVCRCDGLHGAESAHCFQGLAAAAAAIAHECGMFADIFAHLDQVAAVGHLEDLLCLRLVDRPCVAAVLGQRACDIAECQAGLHGGIQLAGDAQMVVLVAAETGADADEISQSSSTLMY